MTILLRPYQDALVTSIRTAFAAHRRVLAVAPTGAGKTIVFARIAQGAAAKGNRIILVAHRIEIVEQIGAALSRERVPHGFISPGRTATPDPVQVAMVQSLSRRLDRVTEPALLVVDEAHHATAGSYQTIANAWPNARILGVTASPARTDGRGLGECFDVMVFGPPMSELIARSYLSPFTYMAPPKVVDLAGVATRAGDYAQDQLAAAMDRSVVTGDAVKHYGKHLAGRPAIAFCVSVAHAEHVAEEFRAAGFRAASVDGSMAPEVRRRRIEQIGNGGLNVLTSCQVVSEGTDIPAVAGALLLRPTQSVIVFLQQVGRVLRVKPDGSAAMILDHVGNVLRHGMPDAHREWSLTGRVKREAPPPVRQCGQCYAAFAPSPRCPCCGFAFPVERRLRVVRESPGELAAVSAETVEQARLRHLRETPLKDLMRGAKTLDALAEIGRARGYASGWARRMMNFKLGTKARAIRSWRENRA